MSQRCSPLLSTVACAACFLLWGCAATARVSTDLEQKLTGIEKALVGIGNQSNETAQAIEAVGSQVSSTQNDLSYAKDTVKYGALVAIALGVVAMIVFVRVFKAAIASAVCKFTPTTCPNTGDRK